MVTVAFIDRKETFPISELLNNEMLSDYDDASAFFLNQWFSNELTIEVQTSGSTGTPKKITLLKESMRKGSQLTLDYFDLKQEATILQCLPSQFIAGKMIWVRAIVGRLNVLVAKPSANPIKGLETKVDFAAMTPHQVATVLEETPEKLNFIDTLIIGGAPVSTVLLEKLQPLHTKCFATYGMTETITHIAVKQLNHTGKSEYFEALPSVLFQFGNNNNLKIQAPHIQSEWLETEDIVDLLDSTHFKWLGRKDFVINSGGVKIFPEVLEEKIANLIPSRFFITKQASSTYGEVPVLVIEGIKDFDVTLLKDVLTKVELPKSVVFITAFKETGSGKIDRIKSLVGHQNKG